MNSIKNDKLIDDKKIENIFIKSFNEAYKLYLEGIESKIFMNKFLNDIVNATESYCGYILSIDHDKKNIEASLNIFLDNKKISSLLKDIKFKKNIYTEKDLINNEIKYIDTKCIEIKYYIISPIKFNERIIGIYFLGRKEYSYLSQKNLFKTLSILLGILMNNYSKTFLKLDNKDIKKVNSFEEILNNITENIILTDDLFEIIFINKNSIELLKRIIDYKNHSKLNFLNIFPKIKKYYFKDNNFNKLFKNYKIKLTHNINDQINQLIKINFIINSVFMDNKIYHVIIISDLIDNDSNKNITKNQNNFIAFLSHELRNPLQSIILSSYLINSKIDKLNLDDKIVSQLNIINKSSNDMKRIIDDIMDLSKVELRELKIELNLCVIRELLQSIYDEYYHLALKKNLLFELIIDEDIPEKLFTDQVRLNQILSNLISNAIKYTNSGKIIVHIKYSKEEKGILFEVSDSGIGIKDDDICLLFNKFSQTTNSYDCQEMSNGLGLYLSQKIANLLGGYIKYQSKCDKGSLFILYHPLNLCLSQLMYSDDTYNIKYNLRGKILLVDDNESNLLLLKMLLDNFILEYNYELQTDCTKNGFDAIELSKTINYDIIFMDINMSDMDGCNTSKIIKKNGYKGIIIAMTGNIMAKKENQSDDDKYDIFNHIIIKPFSDLMILNILNKYLT